MYFCLITGQDGHLIIPADSLLLLPAQLPYELLGPCILAAVDTAVATSSVQRQQDRRTSQHASASQPQQSGPLQNGQQHGQLCLQLNGIDLQEPICGPLTTCVQAYHALQQLHLQELNVDAHAAAAFASIVQHTCCPSQHTSSSTGSGLQGLSLRAVFLCQLAWQSLAKGISAGCQLQTLR